MAEQKTMSPQAKKKFILILIVVLGLFTIGFMIAMHKMEAHYAEQTELTVGLPGIVTRAFDSKERDAEPVLADEFVETVPFGSYLFFRQHTADAGDGRYFSHAYSKSMNEKLGTDIYYGREDIDGVVFETHGMEEVGFYGNSNTRYPKRAMQQYRVLNYMTLPDMVVIRQDTLWGGNPPSSIKMNETIGVGKDVKDKDIVASIKATVR